MLGKHEWTQPVLAINLTSFTNDAYAEYSVSFTMTTLPMMRFYAE